MLTDLQVAVRDFVRAAMIDDETMPVSLVEVTELPEGGSPLPGAALYEVRSVTEADEAGRIKDLPEDRHVVYVKAREAPITIRVLRDVIVELSVGSPADVEGITIPTHAALERAVERVWDRDANPTAREDLDARIAEALPGWVGADYFAEGWQEVREDTELLPAFAVKVGVMKAGL